MDSTDRAFSPEPFGKEDLVTLSIDTIAQAQRALKGLDGALERFRHARSRRHAGSRERADAVGGRGKGRAAARLA